MEAGDPIVLAIAEAEAGSTAEVRVHVTKRLFERAPFKRAEKLFARFGMSRTQHRNAVLLYVNLRRRRFAIVSDRGADRALGPSYWKEFSRSLSQELRATDPERAIAQAVIQLGLKLRTHFPKENENARR
jgi:uncharacterized membrane protein